MYIWTNKGNTLLHSITMKNRFRLFLLAITALMVPLAVYAQDDVTAMYVLNPGFEEGPGFFHDSTVVIPGWDVSKKNLLVAFHNTNDGTPAPQGQNVFGIWAPGEVGDFEISQTVKDLPAGTYVITCVMTTFSGEYTTQRMFASTPSAGTKSRYFGVAALDTIADEKFGFAGYPDNGYGNGPFQLMGLKIKVAAGEPLVMGIRCNGTKSAIAPQLSTFGKNGHFKVDNFRLNFIPDDVAYTKTLIQAQLDLINAIPKDTIPQGYVALIAEKMAWGNTEIATQTSIDSLELCLSSLTDFIGVLGIVKTKLIALKEKLRQFEVITNYFDLANSTDLPGKAGKYAVYNHALEVCNSNNILSPDFDKVYAQLDSIMYGNYYFQLENLALTGTAFASYVSPESILSAVNDGFEPSSSSDTSHTVYENVDGSNGKANWVYYEWPDYYVFTSAYVYWYTDLGRASQPVAATVEYLQDNQWKAAGAIDTALNKWNVLNFDHLATKKVRLSFLSLTSTGICEFGAVGYKNRDICFLTAMISRELTSINALSQDSLPKGYIPLISTFKQQCEPIFARRVSYTNSNTFLNTFSDFHYTLDSAHIAFHKLAQLMDSTQRLLANTNYPNKALLQQVYDGALAKRNSSASLLVDFNSSILTLQSAVESYMATGLVSEIDKYITIYPNPVKDIMTIEFGSLSNCSVRITNVLGQTVYTTSFNNQNADINMTKFATTGLFYVQIFDHQNKLIFSKKILKVN